MRIKATDEALLEAYLNSSYTLSYGFMSADGVLMAAAAPEEYSDSVGLNIGSFEPAKTILSKREPYLTTAFTSIEGFYAIELSYPVFSSDGEYKGAVLCMAEPYRLLGDIISPVENETGASITVMQTDGLILYDRDIKQAGRNLLTDPFFTQYKSLINLGHTICSKKTGYGTYTFYESGADSSKYVKKQAYWDTVENSGQEWRIILFKSEVMGI
ncbi:MAG: PDC sensor domain-containing protein [Methanomicrobium sp.]|nr:PDC sensor domain-containing protein [Methanomicrobium sp.]